MQNFRILMFQVVKCAHVCVCACVRMCYTCRMCVGMSVCVWMHTCFEHYTCVCGCMSMEEAKVGERGRECDIYI